MKNFIILCLLISLLSFTLYAQPGQQKITIAIMDFQNTSGKSNLDYLQQAIPEALITRLAESGNLNIVERTRLEDTLQEMKLGMVGLVDQDKAAEIGKAVGANAIMVGSFLEISNVIRLNARLINVQTSKVVTAKTIQGQSGTQIFNLMDDLAIAIEDQLLGKKSPRPTPTTKPTMNEYLQGKRDGERDAKGNAVWFLSGCLLGGVGIIIAYVVEPSVPTEHLVGKSPEYVRGYSEGYKKKAQHKNAMNAVYGCVALGVGYVILYAAVMSEAGVE